MKRAFSSEYMHWAKTQTAVPYSLANSGIKGASLSDLPVALADLEINPASHYGYPPLRAALAEHLGVTEDRLFCAEGTSMVNHLAMAALLEPGDEVLVESPTYELLLSTLAYFGAQARRFERRHENDFQIDPDDLRRAVTSRTRLIVFTNLHNPSSAYTDEATLREIGRIAAGVGAKALVDEVYLDAAFELRPRTAYLQGPEFITTNSLTKVYGLSGLRCGWTVAEPSFIERLWRLNDLFGVIPAHPAQRLSALAMKHLPTLRERSKAILAANHAALAEFLAESEEVEAFQPSFGTVCFPRMKRPDVEGLVRALREKYECLVVPGHFFEAPEHFRVGLGGDPEVTREAFRRLALALRETARPVPPNGL